MGSFEGNEIEITDLADTKHVTSLATRRGTLSQRTLLNPAANQPLPLHCRVDVTVVGAIFLKPPVIGVAMLASE